MNEYKDYIVENKGDKMTLDEKISSIKERIKKLDRMLKSGSDNSDTLNAYSSRVSLVPLLKAYQDTKKYLVNRQKMYSSRSTSEYDKLEKQNKNLLKDISNNTNVENAWDFIKRYESEYED